MSAPRTAAIVPIKRFGAAKQRLADRLGEAEREALVAAMVADVLEAIGRAAEIDRIIVVSGEEGIEEIIAGSAIELVVDPVDRGHSEAAASGIAVALARGAECALLLPGDCPLIEPAELDRAIAAAPADSVGIASDRHGTGTNGLLLRPPNAIAPGFGPGSSRRHAERARARGYTVYEAAIPSLALDLDTPDDLAALDRALGSRGSRRLAPRTREHLRRELGPGAGSEG